MTFKIAARTILHLGAELIGSDAIAIYELVKNAFDAKSKQVDFSVTMRIQYDIYRDLKKQINNELAQGKNNKNTFIEIQEAILKNIDLTAPKSANYKQRILKANTLNELLKLLDAANYIRVEDYGTGMSKKDLEEIYLTIGTRHRLQERTFQFQNMSKEEEAESYIRPILGEKGVGRLSAMRLGNKLFVKTTRSGEKSWNTLSIDWSLFSHDSDKLLEEINIEPQKSSSLKEDLQYSGTIIRISALSSSWDTKKLEDIGKNELNKLTDPFLPNRRYPINLKFNGEKIRYEHFNKILFQEAHAVMKANFSFNENEEPILKGKVDYRRTKREKNFHFSGLDLLSITKLNSYAVLKSLGPFEVELYWYNRKNLEALDSIGTKREVRDLVNAWSGGLKVYRDGFRVNPYGNPDDDWLGLDKRALASGGYKVNRAQIIGKVEISTFRNPKLCDQTNREGLMDCREKDILILLLKFLIKTPFKGFLDEVDKEIRAREPVKFDEFVEHVNDHQRELRKTLELLKQKYPMVKEDTKIFSTIEDAVSKMNDLMAQAGQLAEDYEEGRSRLVHMAGLGLMVESIAHELNRATSHALLTLQDAEQSNDLKKTNAFLDALEAQLKTLQKRLRILDPLSTRGRQVKEHFDLVEVVQESLAMNEAQFKRHNIKPILAINPPEAKLRIKAVKGMIIQVLQNLISNSVYWIKQQKKLDSSFRPEINVIIDTQKREVYFTDNGPGIYPERAEEIFLPFVSSKPPDEGKGLGLFISREIAEYNDAKLYLLNKHTIHGDKFNTFVLELEVGE